MMNIRNKRIVVMVIVVVMAIAMVAPMFLNAFF